MIPVSAVLHGNDMVSTSPRSALALNFVVGMSVVMGGLLLALTDVSDSVVGIILAYGTGTYIYLATFVTLPNALKSAALASRPKAIEIESENGTTSEKEGQHSELVRYQLLVICTFVVGAACIGLILLNHEHCGEDEHESH